MDARSFLSGAVIGAVVGAASVWLFVGERPEPVAEERAPDAAIEPREPVSAESDRSSEHRGAESDVRGETGDIPVATVDDAPVPVIPERARDRSAQDPDTAEPVVRDPAAWLDRRRERLDAEPKDESWAYYMEQTITQFLGAHPAIGEFDVSYVECRTTTCQIQVIGFDDSTGPTWNRIMYDLREAIPEPTGQWGTSSGDLDGRHAIVTEITRLQQ